MGLQVWLPLISDAHNQGLMGTTFTNNNVTFGGTGKLGTSAVFNGSNGAIYADGINVGNAWTVCCWAKMANAGTYSLFQLGKSANYSNSQFLIHTVSSNTKQIYRICNGNSSGISMSVDYTDWVHYCLTYDGTTCIIYINGTKLIEHTVTDPLISGTRLAIGAYYGTGILANGMIQDFRLYDTPLSPKEVKEIAKGLVLHYPLAMPGGENIIANTSHEIACTYPASGVKDYYFVKTKSVPNETQYTLSFEARSTVDGDHLRTHFYSPNTTTTCESSQGIIKTASDGNMDFTLTTEWRRYWVVYTQTETTAIKSVICPRLCSPASYPSSQSGTGTVYVRNQKLERGFRPTPWIPNQSDTEYSALGFDDGIEYDVSGFQYNGEKYGNLKWSNNSAKYNACYEFDGSSDYIRLKQDLYSQFRLARDEVTVNIWAYKDDWDDYKNSGSTAQWMTMCGCQEGGGFSIYEVGNGRFTFVCGTGASSNSYKVSNTATGYADSLSAGWHMFTLTFDGLSLKGYVDGNLVVSNAFFTTKTPIYYNTGTTSIYIGVESGSGKQAGLWWKGKLSDFRVYTTALSAEDILELYHTPITLANNGTLMTQGEFEES